MALAKVLSRASRGLDAPLVRVEVHTQGGLPTTSIVGLPETAVRESKERVRSAIANSQFVYPDGRVTINLSPADLPKEGGRFDLPIALGILAATGQIDVTATRGLEFFGELSLGGALRPFRGVLPAALAASRAAHALLVPAQCASEAAQVADARVYAAADLSAACAHLNNVTPLVPTAPVKRQRAIGTECDLRDVAGQPFARRALEIAAAGGHSLMFVGPPGTGKTMLARRLPGLLPALTEQQALECAALWSLCGHRRAQEQWYCRPFRAPHHSASAVALAGGGRIPQPGEVSMAHNGVLFLDELPEFQRHALEVLRQPLESGEVTISRATARATYPARVQLLAAMNPCPCGFLGDAVRVCRCTPERINAYRSRISGPLLDRIDVLVEVPRPDAKALRTDAPPGESSADAAARVAAAQRIQIERAGVINADLDAAQFRRDCRPDVEATELLEKAMKQLGLSARSYHRVLKVARTIADLTGCRRAGVAQVSEAIRLRPLDLAGPGIG